jgi:hypothetical protein
MLRIRVIKLVPDFIIPLRILFVESHDVNHSLRMLFLLLLRDTTFLQQSLPFFRKACELARLVVIANMGYMNGIFWCGDLDPTRRA